MADLEKLAGMVDDLHAKDVFRMVMEPMAGFADKEEEAERHLRIYFKARMQANKQIVEHLQQRSAALGANLAEIREKFKAASEGLPKSPTIPVRIQVQQKPKPEVGKPKLLPPQELRNQIARKIERPPAPPQTTGNIWENWGKNPQPPVPPHADEEDHP